MFYFSYLFSVLILVFMVFFMMLVYSASIVFLKFLLMLVYVSGVVVFMLYISCLCWNKSHSFSFLFLSFSVFIIFLWDSGTWSNFTGFGEYMWMFLFFAFLFNSLVSQYSLNLYKNSGSLRF